MGRSTRRTLGLAAAVAAVAAAATALPAAGQGTGTTERLVFTSTQGGRDEVLVDARPNGASPGDRYLVSSLLRRGGAIAGRLEADCLAIDVRYEGMACSVTLILAAGRVTAQGAALGKPIPGVGGGAEEYAITGGTGAYVGAAGTMTRTGDGTRDTVTLAFGA